MKKRKKMKKSIKIILGILLVIIISYITITILNKIDHPNWKIIVPEEKEDQIFNDLKDLNYTEEEIKLIKDKLNNSNISYIIENKINNESILNFIKEPYYIDSNLKSYLDFMKNNETLQYNEVISLVNTHYNSEEKVKTITNEKELIIINDYYYIDNTYEPELIETEEKHHINDIKSKLNKECYDAFIKMLEDSNLDFKIQNAYRSYETQEEIHNYSSNEEKPGHSEHQTGYAIDIITNTNNFESTDSFKWLKENAHKYGFILRYPKNKQNITNHKYNPNHFRYCGIECATYIYENDITFDEYYEYFIKYNNSNNIK